MKTITKPVVLFLCRENSARSQMAEGFLKKYAGEKYEVLSAGLKPSTLNPLAIQVMNEAGISLEGQYSKPISEYLGKVSPGFVISVCELEEDSCPHTWPFGFQFERWPFADPVAEEGEEWKRIERFREVRDQIEIRIKAWLAEQ